MTYDLYDKTSDCSGNQPPGFPTKFPANVCTEGSPGAGVYYFVDCSGGIISGARFDTICLTLLCAIMLLYS